MLPHFPSWNEVRFQTPAGHRRHSCESMCFWWWCWYLFHVYVHSNHLQKENQSHSGLLTFSNISYRKESLELSYKPSNLLPPLDSGGVTICRDRSAAFSKSYFPPALYTTQLYDQYLLRFHRWIKYSALKNPVILEKTDFKTTSIMKVCQRFMIKWKEALNSWRIQDLLFQGTKRCPEISLKGWNGDFWAEGTLCVNLSASLEPSNSRLRVP